jgi:hypothetical protein
MSPFYKQVAEAAAWTFLQMFVVTFGASFAALGSLAWGDIKPVAASAALAALGAALSIIKSMIVRNVGGGGESTLISASEECAEA